MVCETRAAAKKRLELEMTGNSRPQTESTATLQEQTASLEQLLTLMKTMQEINTLGLTLKEQHAKMLSTEVPDLQPERKGSIVWSLVNGLFGAVKVVAFFYVKDKAHFGALGLGCGAFSLFVDKSKVFEDRPGESAISSLLKTLPILAVSIYLLFAIGSFLYHDPVAALFLVSGGLQNVAQEEGKASLNKFINAVELMVVANMFSQYIL